MSCRLIPESRIDLAVPTGPCHWAPRRCGPSIQTILLAVTTGKDRSKSLLPRSWPAWSLLAVEKRAIVFDFSKRPCQTTRENVRRRAQGAITERNCRQPKNIQRKARRKRVTKITALEAHQHPIRPRKISLRPPLSHPRILYPLRGLLRLHLPLIGF